MRKFLEVEIQGTTGQKMVTKTPSTSTEWPMLTEDSTPLTASKSRVEVTDPEEIKIP